MNGHSIILVSLRMLPVVAVALGLVASVTVASAASASTEPLDFRYRVAGTGVPVGIVFDDGRDVFIQPVDPQISAKLRVRDAPFTLQGPYVVVRGLATRLLLSIDGARGEPTVVEYTGASRAETAARTCSAPEQAAEQRATIRFGTGALATEPAAGEQLARALALARGADRVLLVASGDRPDSPAAARRIARVRELLMAGGMSGTAIEQRVQPPATSSVEVVALRRPARGCEVATDPVMPGSATASAAVQPSAAADDPATDGRLRLMFLPNSPVQATLRSFLRAHGLDVEFRSVPMLMVEDVAEVVGTDVRDVLRRALARLGLRGEILGNRLLMVELANPQGR
jgi:hypothetical protein